MSENAWSPPVKPTGKTYDIVEGLSRKLFRRGIEDDGDRATVNKHLDPSLATGGFGLALAAGYIDRVYQDNGWDSVAHSYMKYYAERLQHNSHNTSLFSGLAGMAFTARYLSRSGERYVNLVGKLDDHISASIPSVMRTLKKRYILNREFDLVSGATGVGAYLLQSGNSHGLIKILLALSDRIAGEHGPAFYYNKPKEHGSTARNYDAVDTGMAHGMAGVLSLLSNSMLKGAVRDDRITGAIERLAGWFTENMVKDSYGINWSYRISNHPEEIDPSRTAWCYGTPGISAALRAAGNATNDKAYISTAESALTSSIKKPVRISKLESQTFCHGYCGLLQIFSRTYNDTGSSRYKRECTTLLQKILSGFDSSSRFGYKDVNNGTHIAKPGILDGSAGILMTILAATSKTEPDWDRMFMLS